MVMSSLLAACIAAGIGLGLFLTVWGLIAARSATLAQVAEPAVPAAREFATTPRQAPRHYLIRILLAVAAGALVWWWSTWPVAGIGAALLVWWARSVFGDDTEGKAAAAKVEAVAAWIESVRDVVASGAALSHALRIVAEAAPPGLESETEVMGRRLVEGAKAEPVLRSFARAVNDQTCDEAVIALIRAQRRSGNLAGLLDRLAISARENAVMRQKVIAARARSRTAIRLISATAVLTFAITIGSHPDFLDVYDGPLGQALLALVLALFGLSLFWLVRMGRWQRPARLVDLELLS
jgi:tight adherence protein B